MDSKAKGCILCKDSSNFHYISKCEKFSSPKDKVDKLKSLNLCIKCTKNHKSTDCHFKFHKPCYKCKGKHFSFLCLSSNNQIPDGQSSNNAVIIECNFSNITDDTILPTFCFQMGSMNMRCLKDSGAQSNFIKEDLAEQLGLKVLQQGLCLSLSGFNSTKKVSTKLVEVVVPGSDRPRKIGAYTIKKIPTNLKLPGLSKVVEHFVQKGYKLADPFLQSNKSDNITDLDLVIGSCSTYCVPARDICYGDCGVYSETKFGVTLMGKVSDILLDLEYLPDIANTTANFLTGTSAVEEKSNDTPSDPVSTPDDHVSPDISPMVDATADEASASTSLCEGQSSVKIETSINFCVVNPEGSLVDSELNRATESIMDTEDMIRHSLQYHHERDLDSDMTRKISEKTLIDTRRDENGRLVMPILWDKRTSHLLGSNFTLCKKILNSTVSKLRKEPEKLEMVDQVIKDQLQKGVIEKIENLDDFIKNTPGHSFLAHQPIFKMSHQSTKARIVYLSNITQQSYDGRVSMSHNQATIVGPVLNKKIATAVLWLRFGKYLLTFDLVKAFLQIALSREDSEKLAFLWIENLDDNDYRICGFLMRRLMFGLRCSPAILMIGLYKILIVDKSPSDRINALKEMLFHLLYMDNGAIAYDSEEELLWAFSQLKSIFAPYQFELQQFVSNSREAQKVADNLTETCTEAKQKLLGLQWDTEKDSLSTRKLHLNPDANSKRTILRTIAENFDIYNICGPLLNRARLFMHDLQSDSTLEWDSCLSEPRLRVWRNISKQVNSAPRIEIPRFIGSRMSSYSLVVCTDASTSILGVVVYCIENNTSAVSFLFSKYKLIDKSLQKKSVPCLELSAITMGVEVALDTINELSGDTCIQPLKVTNVKLLTDSLVCLHWLHSHNVTFDKLNKKSIFVQNRLDKIHNLCEKQQIEFKFCSGETNPADCITRCLSYRQLMKSNYLIGPSIEIINRNDDEFNIVVPNPILRSTECNNVINDSDLSENQSIDLNVGVQITRCSTLSKAVKVEKLVLKFVNVLKGLLIAKDPLKYQHFVVRSEDELHKIAFKRLVLREQKEHFQSVIDYFRSPGKRLMDIPPTVSQLNAFIDSDGIIRVKSKVLRWSDRPHGSPILLSKDGWLTKLIIMNTHCKLSHQGIYPVLSQLRREFWIPCWFSTVKAVLKTCVLCRRFNKLPIKLNESPYRDFRLNPSNIPYRNIFVDHIGPILVNRNGVKVKNYLLIITCLWSRSINLKICADLSVQSFVRALQLHIYEHGTPELCLSDMGTSLLHGGDVISKYLDDPEVLEYVKSHNINLLEFKQYPKGCSQLGSLVESCVKIVKRLIFGSVRNLVLDGDDFELLIAKVIHLSNRRPIAFKESLRDTSLKDFVPSVITPEIVTKGYELTSLDIMPMDEDHSDPDWNMNEDKIRDNFRSLQRLVTI